MGKKDIEFKVIGSNEELADYLENLSAGLRKGTLYIEQGTQALSLAPSDELTMELSGKTKEEKQKLSIKLSWRTVPKASEGDSALKIATETPEPAEAVEPESDNDDVYSPPEDKSGDDDDGPAKAKNASSGATKTKKTSPKKKSGK